MSNISIHVDNSKIMIAAAFVQYVIYAIFYLISRGYNPPESANSKGEPNFSDEGGCNFSLLSRNERT